MQLDFIAALADVMSRESLAELEYVAPDGASVRLSRRAAAHAPAGPGPAADAVVGAAPAHADRPAPPDAAVPITAGMPGTFYRSPAPGEPPFANEGDAVEEGQALGLIETMKTLIPVESPLSGTLVRREVENGVLVQPDTVLWTIRPEGRH